MRGVDWDDLPMLPSVSAGSLTFYNVRRAYLWDGEIVQFYIAHNGIIQNGSHPVVMTRAAWDAFVAGAAMKEAA